MKTRREFFRSTAAAALLGLTRRMVRAEENQVTRSLAGVNTSPAARITSLVRRDETILRLGGNGDVYPMTWAADDRQISAFLDGGGWSHDSRGTYNTRAFSINGGPRDARFSDIPSYPVLLLAGNQPRYYGFGTLALDDRIYQFLCALGPSNTGWRWVGTKLIYSPDNGRSWHNQDGSTPVVWESYENRSRKKLLFYREPNNVFSLVSVLQMGRNYQANSDGYVYLYSPNGETDGSMNQLVLARVPKARIVSRGAYEFFAGIRSDGTAAWAKDVEARAVVHTFPRGWVNTSNSSEDMIAQSWLPSVTYNAPLGLYMMANWGDGCSPDGSWFAKPSYLGFWVARNPWVPWTQIHEDTAWTPGDDADARCYSPQISPKWIAPDGASFWLVWTDFQGFGTWVAEWKNAGIPFDTENPRDLRRMNELMRREMPYYAFNAQRVDLIVS